MRMSRVVTALLSVGAVTAAVGIAQPHAASASSSDSPPPAASSAITGAHFLALAIESHLAQSMPGSFGGVALSPSGTGVTVYLTAPTSSNESSVRSYAQSTASANPNTMPSSAPITFAATPTTAAQQDALHQSVTTDVTSGYWTNNGVTVTAWGPDVTTGKENITVSTLTPSVTQALAARYGSNINVVAQTPATTPQYTASRSADVAPWSGGTMLTDESSDCSSGIPVRSGSTYFIVTAAHCFLKGTTVANRSAIFNLGSQTIIGSITNRDVSNGGADAELLGSLNGGTSSAKLYTGSGASTKNTMAGWLATVVGDKVCSDGAFEAEVCTGTVSAISQCQTIEGRYMCYVSDVSGNGTTPFVGNGDSGGPVYLWPALYAGIYTVLGTLTSSYGSTVPCTVYTGHGRTCSAGGTYTQLGHVLSEWNLTVNP